MALLQLPLKAKAGAGSGFSFPAAASRLASIACRLRWARGWGGRGPSAPRTSPRQSVRSLGSEQGGEPLPVCQKDQGSARSQAALAEGRAGHGVLCGGLCQASRRCPFLPHRGCSPGTQHGGAELCSSSGPSLPIFQDLHGLSANVCNFHGPWLQAN